MHDRAGAILCAVMGVIVDSCKKVDKEGLLIKLIDKKLDANGEEEILSHLRACPECLAKMARVLLSDDELQEVFLADREEGLPFDEIAETDNVPPPDPLETPEKSRRALFYYSQCQRRRASTLERFAQT